MNEIVLLKSLVSKSTLLEFLLSHRDIEISENSNSWILVTKDDISSKIIDTLKLELYQLEEKYLIEEKVSLVRDQLYRKAFSPIHHA